MARNSKDSGDMEMAESVRGGNRDNEESRGLNHDASSVSQAPSRREPLRSALSVKTSHSRYDRYSRANDDDETDAGISVVTASAASTSLWKRMKASSAAFFSDMFGSEFDFGAAYRRAKGLGDGFSSSVTTRTDQQDQVRAWEHLRFFPLTFKDGKFETQYGLICSQLFIGRLFLVLIALVFVVIPILWWLGAVCFLDVNLNEQSKGAWIAFHVAFGTNLLTATISLVLTIFPKLIPIIRKYFELYAYANVLSVSSGHPDGFLLQLHPLLQAALFCRLSGSLRQA